MSDQKADAEIYESHFHFINVTVIKKIKAINYLDHNITVINKFVILFSSK